MSDPEDSKPDWEDLRTVRGIDVEPSELEQLAAEMEGEDYDWVTELDREILDTLARGLVLTPAVIADNTDRSRGAVSRRLNTLQAGGLVEKKDRGKYKISKKGMALLI